VFPLGLGQFRLRTSGQPLEHLALLFDLAYFLVQLPLRLRLLLQFLLQLLDLLLVAVERLFVYLGHCFYFQTEQFFGCHKFFGSLVYSGTLYQLF
jgi:hypothetical protein